MRLTASVRRPLFIVAAAGSLAAAVTMPGFAAVMEPPPPPVASTPVATAPAKEAAPVVEAAPIFLRATETDDGRVLRLETVIRSFAPADGEGPTIDLVAAVHIADQAFYDHLQAHLDAKDVVLFEGVKPPGAARAGDELATDEARAARTRNRVRLIAAIAESHKEREGEYPATIEELATSADKRVAYLVETAAADGWGKPLVYTVTEAGGEDAGKAGGAGGAGTRAIDVVSYGADGEPGGEGPAADIAFSEEPPLKESEKLGGEAGIQQQLADALGLVFQLEAMDHSGANWRNSDMSVDQLQERLAEAGADAGALLKTLEGTSISAKLMGFALRLIGSDPKYSAMAKAMLVDVLSRADELMALAPGNMGTMMSVILTERNEVLLDDLRGVIADEPGVETIGIIYGAGHLPEVQSRLVEDFGYEAAGEEWVTAIEIDLEEAGVPAAQMKQLRAMMKRSMDQQMRTLQRQREREEQKGSGGR